MNYITAELKAEWKRNAKARSASWLRDMLTLREICEEHRNKGERVLMEIYAEAAPCFGVSVGALQNKLSKIRNFDDATLVDLVVVKGLSIDAINIASRASANGEIHESPLEFIEYALQNGDAEGRVPTADQVAALVAERTGRPREYWQGRAIEYFAKQLKLPDAVKLDFYRELRELIARYVKS